MESDALPVAVRNSEERLSKGGIYLLETGLNLFLWVGVNTQQELLQNIFGTPAFSQIDANMVQLAIKYYQLHCICLVNEARIRHIVFYCRRLCRCWIIHTRRG